jgi:RNA polymerase sigma-70 factor, ECF subfamily
VRAPFQKAAPPREDPRLIERCREGDPSALETVMRAELPALERVVLRLVGPTNRFEADDVVQLTLIRAVKGFRSFRGESTVASWLTRIATRIVLDRARSRGRRDQATLRLATAGGVELAPSSERVLDAKRALARVWRELERLSTANRVAFCLHVLEGRAVNEVAALMGSTPVTTRSRVMWARRHLKRALARDPELALYLEEVAR